MRQTGYSLIVVLVVIAGIVAGVWLFSQYEPPTEGELLLDDGSFNEEEILQELRRKQDARDAQESEEDEGPQNEEEETDTDIEVAESNQNGESAEPTPSPTPSSAPAPAPTPQPSSSPTYTGTVLAGSASVPMLAFNQADYDRAVAAGETIVLMFHANWCPLCQAESPDSKAAFDDLAAAGIDGVVGFRVNYKDNETDKNEEALAGQYGINFQNSKVIVSGGQTVSQAQYTTWSKAKYLAEINAAL